MCLMMNLIVFALCLNSWMFINANDVIPILQEYASNITLQIGSTLKIVCPIQVNSKQEVGFFISWTVNEVDENMLSMDLRYEFKDSNKILQVKQLRLEDAGVYKCKGVTGYGVREAAFYVKVTDGKYCQMPLKQNSEVNYKPCFLNSLMQNENIYKKVVKDVGSSVEFDCLAAGNPSPEYLWMKGKSSADWIDNITSIRQATLRINNIRLEYTGHYTCKVYNSLGQISYTYTLIVREKHSVIPRIIEDLSNVSAKVEAQAVLAGTISCNCKPIIQWLKKVPSQSKIPKQVQIPNSEESEKNEYYSIIDTDNEDGRISVETLIKDNGFLISILRFKSVTQEDSGKYVLFTTNGNYGMSYKSVYFDVQGATPKNHPRLIIYIAIPIIIVILCFGIIFYCWSRNHRVTRTECSKTFCLGSNSVSSSTNVNKFKGHSYLPSTGTSSGTTDKYSNGSSFNINKKYPPGNVDKNFPQYPGDVKLLPQLCSSESSSSTNFGNVLIQHQMAYDQNFSPQNTMNFNPISESINFSIPQNFHIVSDSDQCKATIDNSQCNKQFALTYSNHYKQNLKVPITQSVACSPHISFGENPYSDKHNPVSPYYIPQGFDNNSINQTTKSRVLSNFSDIIAL